METRILNKRQFTFTSRSKRDVAEVENLQQFLGLDFEQEELEDITLSDFHKRKIYKKIEDTKNGKFLSDADVSIKVRACLK